MKHATPKCALPTTTATANEQNPTTPRDGGGGGGRTGLARQSGHPGHDVVAGRLHPLPGLLEVLLVAVRILVYPLIEIDLQPRILPIIPAGIERRRRRQ
jgi:hypothetical protein